jgi:hypothetical protein
MKLYYLFLLVMFLLMGCTNSPNVSGPDHIGTSEVYGDIYKYTIDEHEYIRMGHGLAHSGTCKKCKKELESTIRKIVKEERSQW